MGLRPWFGRCLLLGLVCEVPLVAALAGVPEPPRPLPTPQAWVLWSNDAFGGEIGDNPDDYRTNAVGFGLRIGRDWVVGLDHSSLTNRGGTAPGPHRTDEITLAIGRILQEIDGDAERRLWLAAGAGLRFSGDFGGASMQNRWHQVFDFERVDLPYEDSAVAGFVWVDLHWMCMLPDTHRFDEMVLATGTRVALGIDQSVVVGSNAELQAATTIRLIWLGRAGAFWGGVRQEMRGGDTLSETAGVVAEVEEGRRLVFGAAAGPWVFEGIFQFETRTSAGRRGIVLGQEPYHVLAGDDELWSEYGGTIGSYGLGAQIRWRPAWMASLRGIGARSTVLLDYRYGRVPDEHLDDASLRYQQVLLGWDLALAPVHDGLQLQPFVYAGVGWRLEDVIIEGQAPEVEDVETGGVVLQGGGGLRLLWGARPKSGEVRYGISLTHDWWAVGNSSAIPRSGGGDLELLDDNHGTSLRLIIQLGW